MTEFPPPRFGTPRDPGSPTCGHRVAAVAARLGSPLLPWQRHVADVALERPPARIAHARTLRRAAVADAREAITAGDYVAARAAVVRAQRARVPWRYKIVVVLVPRQAGKTVLLRAVTVDRALTTPGADLFTTAQLGKDATARWHDMREAVQADPVLAAHVRVRAAQGSESLTFPNAAAIRPFAPTAKAIHGWSPPFVGVDEGWAFDAAQGEALDAAIRGAMLTRTDQQLWVISAAGTDESEWLLRLVERGRTAVEDPTSDMAYFEWSVPDTVDLASPDDAAARFHPALGSLISLEAWHDERAALSTGTFARNMANRWTRTAETVVDLDLFTSLGDPTIAPPGGDVAIAYDVAFDRSEAAIVAAWRDQTGQACWRVVRSAPGTGWLVPAVTALVAGMPRLRAVGADDGGPARSATDDLRKADLDVQTTGARDFATATGDVLTAIEHRTGDVPAPRLVHDGDPAWTDEMAGAALRRMGQAQAWDRAASAVPIPRIIAGTVALRLYDHGQPVLPPPAMRFG